MFESRGLSFTGTQTGMTLHQMARVRAILRDVKPDFVAHGACVGADDEFDAIAAEMGIDRRAYPCTITGKRVPDEILRARVGSSVWITEPDAPLIRNRAIVDVGNDLIACPGEPREQARSGTWSTVRYARKIRKLREVIEPHPADPAVVTPGDSRRISPTRERL